MPTYEVVCESCDAEYSVTSLDGINIDPPAHCSYCGEALNDDLIKELGHKVSNY
jgi:predicted nucleic acid-binding Zn ribbon protein